MVVETAYLKNAMETWGDTVLRLACSSLRDKNDAEDVYQAVFLKLYNSKQVFMSEEHLKAWLLRVTINCCKDELKSARRNRTEPLEEHYASSAVFEVADEVDEELMAAVSELPEKQRVALHLFYFEDLSTEEIASITNEKPSTVRSHLHRARQALRTSLGESSYER